jgi:hypothetical protein
MQKTAEGKRTGIRVALLSPFALVLLGLTTGLVAVARAA